MTPTPFTVGQAVIVPISRRRERPRFSSGKIMARHTGWITTEPNTKNDVGWSMSPMSAPAEDAQGYYLVDVDGLDQERRRLRVFAHRSELR